VVTQGVAGFADLGISPTGPEVILPTYLSRFRPGGGKKAVAAGAAPKAGR
jgi:NADH dehydrogenase